MISFNPETESTIELEKKITEVKQIVLYNDNINTFDHVIDCLIKICKHEPEQAEQCAYIVHYKGKCFVKSGEFKKLKPLCEGLLEKGLSAAIE